MSKGLEVLEKAKNRNGLPLNENFAPITESEINIIEKELKALEIIKERNVWFWVFRRTHNVNEYNEKVALYYPECDELTQEQYDLLKEVLL